MQEEKSDHERLEDFAPRGRCLIDRDGDTIIENCVTEAECHAKVAELQGRFISWDFDSDCN
jgi:hypothetical protein